MDHLRSIAAEVGRADLGIALGAYEIERVVQPGETLISSARPPQDRWHSMLDAVMASGNKAAIEAVQSSLILSHQSIGGTQLVEKRKAR